MSLVPTSLTRLGIRRVALMWIPLAVVALLSAPAALGKPGAPTGREFSMEADDCDEVQIAVPVPLENAQAELPPGFVAAERAPGIGRVAISVRRCQAMSVNEVPTESEKFLLAEVGVFLETPPGASLEFYQLWGLSTVDTLSSRMTHLGLEGGLVTGMSLDLTALGGAVSVPWPTSTYDYSVNAPGPAVIDFPGTTFTWWHDGPRGRIRSVYTFPDEKVRIPFVGTINAAPGSPLADLLGSTQAVGLGAVIALPGFEVVFELTR